MDQAAFCTVLQTALAQIQAFGRLFSSASGKKKAALEVRAAPCDFESSRVLELLHRAKKSRAPVPVSPAATQSMVESLCTCVATLENLVEPPRYLAVLVALVTAEGAGETAAKSLRLFTQKVALGKRPSV
jgi:hypothetical protein